ncbi:MAG TPA: STAS domain-containing protein [Pilimelia sp.]|nr:STAS domain-containing protein [Pilimelia sp.]
MTRTGLSITRPPAGAGVTLALQGEIDMSNVEEMESALHRALAESTGSVVLDLSGVTFCDSLGFSTMIKFWRVAGAAGCEFVVARPGPTVRRILDMMGISSVIRVVDEIPA